MVGRGAEPAGLGLTQVEARAAEGAGSGAEVRVTHGTIVPHGTLASVSSAPPSLRDHLEAALGPAPEVAWTAGLFTRGLGLILALACLSLYPQVPGLIGEQGLSPARETMAHMARFFRPDEAWKAPTLCWLSTSDAFLQGLTLAGAASGLAAALGVLQGPALLLGWGTYLSLSVVGDVFLGYQWDALLLQVTFLGAFLAPWSLYTPLARPRPPPRALWWALRLVLVQLMVQSGLCKLVSQDPTWASWTALEHHYLTQPLPTPLGWWAHQLPGWVHAACCGAMFAIELGAPLVALLPGRAAGLAVPPLVGLQLGIALTGNYGFFNLLSAWLCLTLLRDDQLWPLLPDRAPAPTPGPAPGCLRRLLAGALLILTGLSAAAHTARMALGPGAVPAWVARGQRALQPLRSFHGYGLFAVMTTRRPELTVQGTLNGRSWHSYRLAYKPGALDRAPAWAPLHMPRLDWQLWFAALRGPRRAPWVQRLVLALLEGRRPVLDLFAHDPFRGEAPRAVRVLVQDYTFTDPAERRRTGAWWRAARPAVFTPASALRAGPR